jgi:hypothetical protein
MVLKHRENFNFANTTRSKSKSLTVSWICDYDAKPTICIHKSWWEENSRKIAACMTEKLRGK